MCAYLNSIYFSIYTSIKKKGDHTHILILKKIVYLQVFLFFFYIIFLHSKKKKKEKLLF